jgi:hypothetical protein
VFPVFEPCPNKIKNDFCSIPKERVRHYEIAPLANELEKSQWKLIMSLNLGGRLSYTKATGELLK